MTQPPEHTRKVIVIDPGHGGRDSGAIGGSSYERTSPWRPRWP